MGIREILTKALVVLSLIIYTQGCKNPAEPKDSLPPDTTSHYFSWQKFEFGDYPGTGFSSMLYDVAIVNENDIWASGEIYIKDTTEVNGYKHYNAMHWNGSNWELKTIYYHGYDGFNYFHPLRSVMAIDSTNIWFSNLTRWDGKQFISIPLNIPFPVTINKIFGKTSKDIYIAGTEGSVAHYDGSTWKKIESGTTIDLQDIFSLDGKDIYIAGGQLLSDEGILLKGNTLGFQKLAEGKRTISRSELFHPFFNGTIRTIWISPSNTLYFSGGLFYQMKQGQMDLVKSFEGNDYGLNTQGQYFGYLADISGNSDNDMVIVGEGNTIRHYNGVNWKQLGMPYNYSSDYTWERVAMKGNIIEIVGRSYSNAIIMLLKR